MYVHSVPVDDEVVHGQRQRYGDGNAQPLARLGGQPEGHEADQRQDNLR